MWDIPAFEIGALVIWDMPACRDTFFSIHEACPVLGRVADEKKKRVHSTSRTRFGIRR